MEPIGTMMITSSVLILSILLLRWLCRGKISQRLWYAVWLLVAAKLLTAPFTAGISSPFSVMNLFDMEKLQGVLEQEETIAAEGESGIDAREEYLNAKEAQKPQMDEAAAWNKNRTDLLRLVWYIGAGVFGVGVTGYNLVYYLSLRRRRILYDTVDNELSCYLVEGLPSPCLFGKSIYLPVHVVRDKQMLSHVLAHEYAHYRQKDMLWGFIRCICVVLYWYHPLVWLAAYVSRQDSEFACDEAAIAALGEKERFAYGKSLLKLVQKGQKMAGCIGYASGMSGSGRRLKERMMKITRKSNTRITTLILLAMAMVLLAGCTFTNKDETGAALESTEGTDMAEGTVNTDALFMREAPEMDGDIVGLLAEGRVITVVEEVDEYYKISISSEDGTMEGYVKKEYIDME